MRPRRAGQAWGTDLSLSVLVFTAALLITYNLAANTIQDAGAHEVDRQARDAARVLAGRRIAAALAPACQTSEMDDELVGVAAGSIGQGW